ncbi:hypothetical protein ACRALDRAFT_206198 [Sodiomyces alcalophilus JCM 7366]|uniref:uncharacterized protein n=1 Tax=Sodiomyces alcalophilus JCM 7366 TaxID=591952 RepID=UPI0039B6AA82
MVRVLTAPNILRRSFQFQGYPTRLFQQLQGETKPLQFLGLALSRSDLIFFVLTGSFSMGPPLQKPVAVSQFPYRSNSTPHLGRGTYYFMVFTSIVIHKSGSVPSSLSKITYHVRTRHRPIPTHDLPLIIIGPDWGICHQYGSIDRAALPDMAVVIPRPFAMSRDFASRCGFYVMISTKPPVRTSQDRNGKASRFQWPENRKVDDDGLRKHCRSHGVDLLQLTPGIDSPREIMTKQACFECSMSRPQSSRCTSGPSAFPNPMVAASTSTRLRLAFNSIAAYARLIQ